MSSQLAIVDTPVLVIVRLSTDTLHQDPYLCLCRRSIQMNSVIKPLSHCRGMLVTLVPAS